MKKIFLAVIVLSIVLFGCASSNVKIQPTAAIYWYPASDVSVSWADGGDEDTGKAFDAYYGWDGVYQTNVDFSWASTFQLSVKLFDKYGASFGLNIDDPTFSTISKFLGYINSEKFGVKINYHSIKGNWRWTGGDLGTEYGFTPPITPPNANWTMDNTMVALFYLWDLEEFAGIEDAPMQVGFFWKQVDSSAFPLKFNDAFEIAISSARHVQNFYGLYVYWDFGEVGREDKFESGYFPFFHVEFALGFNPSAPKSEDGTVTIGSQGYLMGGASLGVGKDKPIGSSGKSTLTWWLGLDGRFELMDHNIWSFGPFFKIGVTF